MEMLYQLSYVGAHALREIQLLRFFVRGASFAEFTKLLKFEAVLNCLLILR